nr:type II secretory pathway protein [uncultured Undibacterium sp.]
MKIILLLLVLFSSISAHAQYKVNTKSIKEKPVIQAKIVHPEPSKYANFNFQFVNISQVVNLIFGEALKTPYVLDPELLEDKRSVSFRYESGRGDLKPFLANFLDTLGYSIVEKNGIQYISKKLVAEKIEVAGFEKDVFLYVPKYREASYLSRLLSPLFRGSFTSNRTVNAPIGAQVDHKVPEGSAAGAIEQNADVLVFSGSDKEVEMLKNLLSQIDVRQGEVIVKGVLYEVTSSDREGSALTMALNLLGGKFGISMTGAKSLDSFVKFKNNSVDLIYSALSTDSRFKVVSTPSLRVRSGATGSFTVGQDVPVLGAVNYQATGVPVQSIEYKSSGVIFNLSPMVHENIIDLNVTQQVSNFVTTETGVNNSPTLIKREVKTALSMADGDVVVLGGLTENKEAGGGTGFSFLPNWAKSKNSNTNKSEILLVLQLNKL